MTDTEFPAIITGSGDLAAFLANNKQAVDAALGDAGALLFRGFDVPDPQAFDAAIGGYGEPGFTYEDSLSNAVRTNVTPRVFTANEAPPTTEIFLHHEMAQTPLFPRWILFSCEVAAEKGGETPLCRSDVLLQRLQVHYPQFVDDCRHRGLQYTNVMPDSDDAQSGMGRSWRSTLGVDSVEAAEQRLRDLGYSWEWLEDGSLKATTPALPAVMDTSDGRSVFFNQLIAAFCGWKDERNDPSQSIRHGDGTALDAIAVKAAADIAEDLAFDLKWQVGDVVLVDNTIAMHARRPFVGKRKVVASLAEMQTQEAVH